MNYKVKLTSQLHGPLTALPYLTTDSHSSLSSAFCHQFLKFISVRSFSISTIHFIVGLPHLLLPYSFTLKYLKFPFVNNYYYIANIFDSLIFNACYSVQIFIQLPHSLTTSHYPHSSLYHRSICP